MPNNLETSTKIRISSLHSQQNLALFKGLSLDELETLLNSEGMQVREFSPNAELIKFGNPVSEAYLILDGEVRIQRLRSQKTSTQNGTVFIVQRKAGEIVGEEALIDLSHRKEDVAAIASVIARTPCTVLVMPKTSYFQFVQVHPVLQENLKRILLSKIEQHLIREETEKESTLQRLAEILQDKVSDGQGKNTGEVTLRISQKDLADLAFCSERSIQSALQELRRRGIVLNRSRGGHGKAGNHRIDLGKLSHLLKIL